MSPTPFPWPLAIILLLVFDACLYIFGWQTLSNAIYTESLHNHWMQGAYVLLVIYGFFHLFVKWWPL